MPDGYTASERSRVKRLHERGHYDHETVHTVIDAATFCHVGYVIDGQPYVTPTLHWRVGTRLYWHGSSASRMLRTVKEGVPACVTVALMDGLVLARSGFHCSVNYRSVMAFGTAHAITDDAEKTAALEEFVEGIVPGHWAEMRPPNGQEIKATTVVGMEIEEAVAKIRTGPPADDEEDYALPCWAGVIPVTQTIGAPIPDPRLTPGIEPPDYLAKFSVG